VFDTLIETKRVRSRKRFLGVGLLSLALHAALIAGAVMATFRAGSGDSRMNVDTSLVYLAQQQVNRPLPPPVALDVPLQGFQTIVAPAAIPTDIPPVNLAEHWDPKDYTGVGVEGGMGSGAVPVGSEVFSEAIVEERPSLLSAPAPQYPEVLEEAGIQGRVLIQAVIDTLGRIEPGSLKVLESPNPGFDQPSRNYLLRALFRPARMHGRAVRVLVTQPVLWQLTSR